MTRRSTAGNKRSQQRQSSAPGRLRIVAGNWRSRVLDIADVSGLRPTPERVRETLFNWLTPRIAGSRCLDLFAGTGALGLEALSREARSVVFVEKSPQAITALQRNIASLEASGAEVLRMDAIDFLGKKGQEAFDFVFLDPPFADERLAELCRLLDDGQLLAPGANVYLEEERSRPETKLPEGWVIQKQKTAGNVRYALVVPGARPEQT